MSTFTQQELTLSTCLQIFEQAKLKAEEIGFNIALTIVDTGGNTKLFARMDGAPLMASDISRKKAVTAIGFGMPTGEPWNNFIKDDPILNNGVSGIEDFMLLGGGKPLIVDDLIVGAIGVSGGHYSQDESCCDAGMTILA